MSKVSGHGGWWAIEVPAPAQQSQGRPAPPWPLVHNAEWEAETEVEVRETRTAGCGGWTEGLPKIRRLVALTLSVAEDDVAYPQALGLTEGAELTLWLKRGALFQFDRAERTLVQRVRVVNDNTKARRVQVTCVHGRYARNVTPPGAAVPPPANNSPGPQPAPPPNNSPGQGAGG